jgi:hypothetical protein
MAADDAHPPATQARARSWRTMAVAVAGTVVGTAAVLAALLLVVRRGRLVGRIRRGDDRHRLAGRRR